MAPYLYAEDINDNLVLKQLFNDKNVKGGYKAIKKVDMMEIDESKLLDDITVWMAEYFLKYAKDCKICLFA